MSRYPELRALEQLGWLDEDSCAALVSLVPPPLKNAAGIEVGEIRAVLELKRSQARYLLVIG